MNPLECPLKHLVSGYIAVNCYQVNSTINVVDPNRIDYTHFRISTIYRLNCVTCAEGYVDFTASESEATGDDNSRFQAEVEKVIGVQNCGLV